MIVGEVVVGVTTNLSLNKVNGNNNVLLRVGNFMMSVGYVDVLNMSSGNDS